MFCELALCSVFLPPATAIDCGFTLLTITNLQPVAPASTWYSESARSSFSFGEPACLGLMAAEASRLVLKPLILRHGGI